MHSHLLPIDNVQQRDANSCWLAIAQSLVRWRHGATPTQRGLAISADVEFGSPGTDEQFFRILSQQAQLLPEPVPDLDPAFCRLVFARHRPIVAFADVGDPHVGHALLIRGIFSSPNADSLAIVNDPAFAEGYSLAVPFATLRSSSRRYFALSHSRN